MPKPFHAGSVSEILIVDSRSNRPMISTSEVSLNSAMKVLTSGGTEMRSACGRMMSQVRRQ